jgi:O-antigen/teichoic acid export membrane protein
MALTLGEVLPTLIARGVAMVGPLVVSIITARALGPADRGEYFLILSYAQIAAQIANLGLQSSNTYLSANRRELAGPLLVNSLYAAFLLAPIAAIVVGVVFGWPQLLGLPGNGNAAGPGALLAGLLAPLLLVLLFVSNLAVGIGRVMLFNLLTIGYSLVSVLAAGLLWWAKAGPEEFLLGSAAAIVIVSLIGIRALALRWPNAWRFDLRLFRQSMGYAFKAYLATMFGFLLTRVGILALQQHASLAEIGRFSVAVQLTDGLAQLPATIGILLFPMMIRTEPRHRRAAMWRAMLQLGGAMLAILIIGGIAALWLIPLLFGPAFAKSVPFTLAMFPQLLVISVVTVLSQYLAAEGFPWRQVWAWVAGFVLQAVLSYIFTAIWGAYGLAISLAITNTLIFLILLWEVMARRPSLPEPQKA